MRYNDVICGRAFPADFKINKNELAARLASSTDDDKIKELIEEHNSAVSYRYAYAVMPVNVIDDIIEFDFMRIQSKSLAKVLDGSKQVVLIAFSSGIDIDRLISKKQYISNAEAFILDAIASAGVESFANYVCNAICAGKQTTKRFSPGYADFPLESQNKILKRLDAQNTVGITLSNDLLMIPMKSITAVIGIKK